MTVLTAKQKPARMRGKLPTPFGYGTTGQCIWNTPAQAYLASRACAGMFPVDRDAVFRWHPACPFGTGQLPCLLAIYPKRTPDDPQGVHRTPLTLEGKRATGPDGEKIKRQAYGPTTNGAIKLWPSSTVTNRCRWRGDRNRLIGRPAYPAPSSSIVAGLGLHECRETSGDLPVLDGVETLTILVDNDPSGTGEREAAKCAERWQLAGREVFRLIPKVLGFRFNDIINRGRRG